MSTGRRVGILGGTFDPVHYGHLDAGDAAAAQLGLAEIICVPSSDPPHRDPARVSAYHRFALIALAIAGRDGWRLSDAEVTRGGRSYTVDTLRALHTGGLEPTQIFFIIGADAFAEIGMWRAFPEVLDLAHFVVIARPGTSLTDATDRYPSLAPRVRAAARGTLDRAGKTGILLVDARTRDVSSTVIRDRLATGARIDDLVPAAVARHIVANSLYGAVNGLHGQDESGKSTSGPKR
jgi:nicotinate-nucleotide adenylyltransferase